MQHTALTEIILRFAHHMKGFVITRRIIERGWVRLGWLHDQATMHEGIAYLVIPAVAEARNTADIMPVREAGHPIGLQPDIGTAARIIHYTVLEQRMGNPHGDGARIHINI